MNKGGHQGSKGNLIQTSDRRRAMAKNLRATASSRSNDRVEKKLVRLPSKLQMLPAGTKHWNGER